MRIKNVFVRSSVFNSLMGTNDPLVFLAFVLNSYYVISNVSRILSALSIGKNLFDLILRALCKSPELLLSTIFNLERYRTILIKNIVTVFASYWSSVTVLRRYLEFKLLITRYMLAVFIGNLLFDNQPFKWPVFDMGAIIIEICVCGMVCNCRIGCKRIRVCVWHYAIIRSSLKLFKFVFFVKI